MPPTELLGLLEHQGILQQDEPEQFYSLCQTTPGGWTNSSFGTVLLQKFSIPLVVLDALSWHDIESLPKEGAFLYLGDRQGGFYAPTAGLGSIPCPRCLLLRYLSNQRATVELYQALHQGERVALETERPSALPECPEGRVLVYGRRPKLIDSALPLSSCHSCLQRIDTKDFAPGPFHPIRRVHNVGERHFASLGQLAWLTGYSTVGGGSAWDRHPIRGRERAMNEALERYCAHFAPNGTNRTGVPFVSDLGTKLVPRRRALLIDPGAVSTGLACRRNLEDAIKDGLREVCERHALAIFWLRADRGEPAARELSSLTLGPLDVVLYQLESYLHPTVLALGRSAQGRICTGSACGELENVKEKALQECLQNWEVLHPSSLPCPEGPETFEEHALTYWCSPEMFPPSEYWENGPNTVMPLLEPVWHCDLTTADLALLGLRAVRVHHSQALYPPMDHRHWKSVISDAGLSESPPTRPHPFA